MKTILLSTAALAVALVAAPAMAADPIMPAPVYTPPAPVFEPAPAAQPVFEETSHDWAGFYAGVNVGHSWGVSDHDGGADFDVDGYLAGGVAGYNFHIDDVVAGVELDLSWADLRGEDGALVTSADWYGTARARVGYAFDGILPYLSGGLALTEIHGQGAGYDAWEIQAGLAAGAGVEVAVTENVSLKTEYLYTNFGGEWVLGDDAAQELTLRDNHQIRAGLNVGF